MPCQLTLVSLDTRVPRMGIQTRPAAELLAEALAREGWSQGELERRLDAADGSVSRWVNGKRGPGLKHALEIERMLGVPASAWTKSGADAPSDARRSGTTG